MRAPLDSDESLWLLSSSPAFTKILSTSRTLDSCMLGRPKVTAEMLTEGLGCGSVHIDSCGLTGLVRLVVCVLFWRSEQSLMQAELSSRHVLNL